MPTIKEDWRKVMLISFSIVEAHSAVTQALVPTGFGPKDYTFGTTDKGSIAFRIATSGFT
jgi:hypothetical protein